MNKLNNLTMKNGLIYLSVLLLTAFAWVGCDDTEVTPENTNGDNLKFSYQEQSREITFQTIAGDDWIVQYKPDDVDWCSLTPGSNGKATIWVDKNDDSNARSTKIVISKDWYTETISITQDAERYIDFSGVIEIPRVGGTTVVRSVSNLRTDYVVTITKITGDWLTEAYIDGSRLYLTATTRYPGLNAREATINIKGTSSYGQVIDQDVTIIQPSTKGLLFHFDLPDFSESKVYKVMLDGIQVGEVAKEFVRISTPVSFQAAITYPMNAAGRGDLTNGLIAQVLLNNNDGNFEAPPAGMPIHGGSISFNIADNIVSSYKQGTLTQPATRITYIREEGIFTTDYVASSEEMKTEPYTLVDTRGPNGEETYEYPIVKVGTQYWLGENLKTTYYNDNQPIETNVSATAWGAAYTNGYGRPMCCVYGYDDANSTDPDAVDTRNVFGVLYTAMCIGKYDNRQAMINDTRSNGDLGNANMLAPAGWGIPSITQTLSLVRTYTFDAAPSTSTPNRRLRYYVDEYGNQMFEPVRRSDENITGFTGRNTGIRQYNTGEYLYKYPADINSTDLVMAWWTLSMSPTTPTAIYYYMFSSYGTSTNYSNRGLPVRCIRD